MRNIVTLILLTLAAAVALIAGVHYSIPVLSFIALLLGIAALVSYFRTPRLASPWHQV